IAMIIPSSNLLQPIILYIGSVFWTIMYDTVYAHQDKDDDRKIKMHSMANSKLGTKKWLKNFSLISFSLINLANIACSGNIISILLIAIIEYYNSKQLMRCDINNKVECSYFFKYQVRIGYFILCAIIIGRIGRF
ncbi:MAG: hypothetical protein OEY79_04800, partial [Anaplasmataceae bacterium]|nr:hypothetical protein [Anaplasmataceae bacterium]